MPVHHSIWKVGLTPEPLAVSKLVTEKLLEDMITSRPEILSAEWMLIGRQEKTSYGGIIDLLAIAPDGSLVLVELKRDKTPREIVAQALDYASWVEGLNAEKISQVYDRFRKGGSLEDDFRARFHEDLEEDMLNQSHQIIIMAAELDDATERIISYLNARGIAINALFFQVFQNGEEQLLSRAWLIDPGQTQANAATASKSKSEKEPWNGEFYVSFGDTTSRSWEDARHYGFISAGGGVWYHRTLKMLSPGDLVWVKIPDNGYVGVGLVTGAMQRVADFRVETPDGERPALDVLKHRELYRKYANDPEKAEYFVPVRWLVAVPREQAFQELGFFGNQNTVCRPQAASWRHTVERLKAHFPGWETGRDLEA